MKEITKLLGLSALAIGLLMTGCATGPKAGGGIKLSAPENLRIEVAGRLMTITWDAVPNAPGYEIVTTSENCGSGNRMINTKERFAATNTGTNAMFSDGRNGAVQIIDATTVQITLMPENPPEDHPDSPMATAVTAKIKSLDGITEGQQYLASDYSPVVTKKLR
ncbi:MAG: hypothetical protein LBH44_02885 [Treponema sp.]|jgi:hypothetical protein|nr:hypothetical protein [Treponema sp.]